MKAALQPPVRLIAPEASAIEKFFGVFSDPRAYTSLFFMLLTLATGILYFTFAVTGLALSGGLSILIIGVPFFLLFIGISRVISLGEGRLIEAISGERMPRRPVHPGAPKGFGTRIFEMLKDVRTWTTLFYFLLMLPLGIFYFTAAVAGLSVGLSLIATPLLGIVHYFGGASWMGHMNTTPAWIDGPIGYIVCAILGVLILTLLMHLARGVGRVHARLAKALLVTPGT